jgi:hypothetical protein
MIPKKHSSIYKQVSEDLSQDELLVEQLVEFYYKQIRSLLSDLKEPRINVEGLGHFVIKQAKVKKAIPHYKNLISNHSTETFRAYHKKALLEKKLDQLIEIEKKLVLEEERKNKFKDEKYTENNLAEPETDSGGNN